MANGVLINKIYNVRAGDTLLRLAELAGIKYDELLGLNRQIKDPNLIGPGDGVVLPQKVSRQNLITAAAKSVYTGDEPLWFKIARREIGVAEKDPGSNPRILEYLATTTLSGAQKQTDATAWCSAFVNWAIRMAGSRGTDSAWALDWKSWGKSTAPKPGAVVVFARTNATTNGGHVGFYIEETSSQVTILGGNQGNRVSIDSYPKNGKKGSFKYVLQDCRWPN